ncbi:MAG: pyruvate, phosphate dikinase [Alphaproteobacteria bacterium]|nr:pyruvate, phosphate dikinase [Alphaproteobacteria bacterium]
MTANAARKPDQNSNVKWVYSFGRESCDGDSSQRNLLGSKGANLAEMSRIGLPVPPGFTLSTEVCTFFYENENKYPEHLQEQVNNAIVLLEQETNMEFGDARKPLLLAVRSGSRVSMPGMMDTVLNIGLNDETVKALGNDKRFAFDCYRRLIQMYGDVVLGVPRHLFEDVLDAYKERHSLKNDTDINAEGLEEITVHFKKIVEKETGHPFPQDPRAQLWGAIGAVFNSWMTPRAVTYRRINSIPEDWGTAVNVQAVVFGNMGDDCATGVAFTRDPSTGENIFYGEYLVNAQGEDVVAGIRTPQPLDTLKQAMPEAYEELLKVRSTLENHFHDMQDIEFTIQNKNLYMLQTRNGKRTATAALRCAVEMVEEGLINQHEALLRIDPAVLDKLLHPAIDPNAQKTVLAKGLPASPGAAAGEIVFDADRAEKLAAKGKKVILCRMETSPEDIHGMHAAEGILTSRGGMTSHAAVVARGMGKPCVSGAGDIAIDYRNRTMSVGGKTLKEGDVITLDGGTGEVLHGRVPMREPEVTGHFSTVMGWADNVRRMKVRANAETPHDAQIARDFGAEGIGLCRTEHMFFDPARILHMRQMILSETSEERRTALDKLFPHQKKDFIALFKIMTGLPVTVRLLDPPLHEFLPQGSTEIEELAKTLGLPETAVRKRISRLHESNPMLGLRGARLGILYPEIYEMQVRAILEAAAETNAVPEIMIPLISTKKEMEIMKALVERVAGDNKNYIVGTMVELPRAALAAGDIAEHAAFFSFGTNDLTQTALGISRDDAGYFLPEYERQGIFTKDPFSSIDVKGVGELVKTAVERGQAARPDIKLGICGEHGGDPSSIAFFEGAKLDYVSCSPFRVPIARLSAAQATLRAAKISSSS